MSAHESIPTIEVTGPAGNVVVNKSDWDAQRPPFNRSGGYRDGSEPTVAKTKAEAPPWHDQAGPSSSESGAASGRTRK